MLRKNTASKSVLPYFQGVLSDCSEPFLPGATAENPSEAARQQLILFRFLFQHHSDALS
jgi:hypothetical protein